MAGGGLLLQGELTNDRATIGDPIEKRSVLRRVGPQEARTGDGDRPATGLHGRLMGQPVDTAGSAGRGLGWYFSAHSPW